MIQPISSTTVLRRFFLWALICGVSATPSFLLAREEFNVAAMCCGVGVFTLLYTLFTSTRSFERTYRRPFVRRTMYIGYGARLILSIVVPVGTSLDMFPGMLSLDIVQGLGFDTHQFAGTLVTTIVQGTMLNIILSIFMIMVYLPQKWFMTPPPSDEEPRGFEVLVNAAPRS